jgi:hypothetical protein
MAARYFQKLDNKCSVALQKASTRTVRRSPPVWGTDLVVTRVVAGKPQRQPLWMVNEDQGQRNAKEMIALLSEGV